MYRRSSLFSGLLPVGVGVILAVGAGRAGQSQPDRSRSSQTRDNDTQDLKPQDRDSWKNKQSSEWTDEEAKGLVTSSPWAKGIIPALPNTNNGASRGMGRGGGGGGRRGGVGIGVGGVGIGMPGGGGRRGGGGYPGGNQGGQRPGDPRSGPAADPLEFILRWESAKPIRDAELKMKSENTPTIDDAHYALALYNVPQRMLNGDRKKLLNDLKKASVLKREGKKDIKASSVDILQGEDGSIILFLFPRTQEITKGDTRIEFDSKINKITIVEPFFTEDMQYQGKLEL